MECEAQRDSAAIQARKRQTSEAYIGSAGLIDACIVDYELREIGTVAAAM
jgi:hypothetical protein